jgi:amidohydrolase
MLAHRHELAGTLKFCFQPCEEGFGDEGLGGNEMMIRDGVLESPQVDRTLALHLWNDKPIGWLGIAAGPVMAGAGVFTMKLAGRGGHGASPHLTADPILAAAQIIVALQSIVARNVAPLEAAVVSVTTVNSGTAFNIIPQTAQLTGTIRTFDLRVRDRVLQRFEEISKGIAEAMGCHVHIETQQVTPAVINDAEIARRAQDVARVLLPDAEIDSAGYFTMGAEDMAFMQERVPGCYIFVGSNNKDRHLDYGHHHPKFDFDEQALPRAAALMAAAASEILR